MGRSLKRLIETITGLNNRPIGFKSITENIDTSTSGGKLIFHIFEALAEAEQDILRERPQANLTAQELADNWAAGKALTPKKQSRHERFVTAKPT